MLENLPDEKMPYVVDMLKLVTGILDGRSLSFRQASVAASGKSAEAIKAWEELQAYKSIIPYDIDEKAELAKARDEKFS
jgi:hypothetical protein